jgi:hypothetical protein
LVRILSVRQTNEARLPDGLTFKEFVVTATAVVALVVSFVSLYRTGRLQRQQMKLHAKQEQLLDRQLAKHADIRVSLGHERGSFRFVIRNAGAGSARNVTFSALSKEGSMSPLVRGDFDKKLPIPELPPGEERTILAALSFGSGLIFDAKWAWLEADGSTEERSGVITT